MSSVIRKIIALSGTMLPASHRGVGPMVGGTHPSVREREHSPRLCNNNPCNTHALLFLVYVKHILHGRVYVKKKNFQEGVNHAF